MIINDEQVYTTEHEPVNRKRLQCHQTERQDERERRPQPLRFIKMEFGFSQTGQMMQNAAANKRQQ
ncbi:hypothetical protein DWB58_04795 [candidate division KSB1 bacterium]|nr:hypothetical protein [candidate division KSB1 bacterium]